MTLCACFDKFSISGLWKLFGESGGRKGIAMASWLRIVLAVAVMAVAAPALAAPDLATLLSYPFIDGLTAARDADRIAWTVNVKGVRSVKTAAGPTFAARTVTAAAGDDGMELTGLVVSPDGQRLVWVRGGDHDANWEENGRQPNPAAATEQPKLTLWTALAAGGPAVAIGEGDAPALANDGRLAFVKGGELWVGTAVKDGAKRVYDEGKARDLVWSPDGSRLAFVSGRGDHAFVGVYSVAAKTVTWAAPSTGVDGNPVWSPDGSRLAFTRRWNNGGAPEPYRVDTPHPWAIVVADAATGAGHVVWASPKTLVGSYPGVPGGAELTWGRRPAGVPRRTRRLGASLCPAGRRRRGDAADAGQVYRRKRPPGRRRQEPPLHRQHRPRRGRRRPPPHLPRRRRRRGADDGHRRPRPRVRADGGGPAVPRLCLGLCPAPGDGRCRAVGRRRPGGDRPWRRRLSGRRAHRAAAGDLYRRRRHDDPRPAVHHRRRGEEAGGDLRPRRAATADAARLVVYGVLLERLCGEPGAGGARLRRPVGQLPARHRLWPRVPAPRQGRPGGGERVSGRRRRREIPAVAARCRRDKARHLGRGRTAAI